MASSSRSVPPDPIDRFPPHLASMIREYFRTQGHSDMQPSFVTLGKQNLFKDPATQRVLIWKADDGTVVQPRYVDLGQKGWKALVIKQEGCADFMVASAKMAGRKDTRTQLTKTDACHSAYYRWTGGNNFEAAPSVFKIFPPMTTNPQQISATQDVHAQNPHQEYPLRQKSEESISLNCGRAGEASQIDDSDSDDRELGIEERARWKPRRSNPLLDSSSSSGQRSPVHSPPTRNSTQNKQNRSDKLHAQKLAQPKQSDELTDDHKFGPDRVFFLAKKNNRDKLPEGYRPAIVLGFASSKISIDKGDEMITPSTRRRTLIDDMVYESTAGQPLTPETSTQASPTQSRLGKEPSPVMSTDEKNANTTDLTAKDQAGTSRHGKHEDDLFVDQVTIPEPMSGPIATDQDPAGMTQANLLLSQTFPQTEDDTESELSTEPMTAQEAIAKQRIKKALAMNAPTASLTNEKSGMGMTMANSLAPVRTAVRSNFGQLGSNQSYNNQHQYGQAAPFADPTGMCQFAKARTFFNFNSEAGTKRKAFEYCSNVNKFFAQAMAAKFFHKVNANGGLEVRLFDDDILLVQIAGCDDRLIPRGDEEAFNEMLAEIAGLTFWRFRMETGTCEIHVQKAI